MITYEKLWSTMEKSGITQYKLIHEYGFSKGQLDRIRKNEGITTHTVDMLCRILKCRVEDIMEYKDDN